MGIWGAFGLPFFVKNGQFWVVEGQVEGQTGGTFLEKWRDKSG